MSFDINPPTRNLSNVQASAKSCSGGGGNTGYFRRDEGEEDEVKLSFKDTGSDSFVKEEVVLDEVDEEGFLDFLKRIFADFIKAIKSIFIKK